MTQKGWDVDNYWLRMGIFISPTNENIGGVAKTASGLNADASGNSTIYIFSLFHPSDAMAGVGRHRFCLHCSSSAPCTSNNSFFVP